MQFVGEKLAVPGIYEITCVLNGKVYIGSSKNVAIRFNQHLSNLRNKKNYHPHLQAAWNKYGEQSFRFRIVEVCSIEELQATEQHHLDRSRAYDRTTGFNTSPRAESCRGVRKTPEQIERMRLRLIGRPQSEVTRQRRRVSCIIAKDKLKVEFDVISPQGELIRGRGVNAFCKEHGLCQANFRAMLNGKIKSTLGWTKAP